MNYTQTTAVCDEVSDVVSMYQFCKFSLSRKQILQVDSPTKKLILPMHQRYLALKLFKNQYFNKLVCKFGYIFFASIAKTWPQ